MFYDLIDDTFVLFFVAGWKHLPIVIIGMDSPTFENSEIYDEGVNFAIDEGTGCVFINCINIAGKRYDVCLKFGESGLSEVIAADEDKNMIPVRKSVFNNKNYINSDIENRLVEILEAVTKNE